MQKRKKRLKCLKQSKKFIWLNVLFIFLVILLTALSLQYYLYDIQIAERLSKVKDPSKFSLSIKEQNRKENRYQFTFDETDYYFDGLEQIYVSYGSSVVFLEEALQKEYIDLELIINGMKELGIEGESTLVYYHTSTSPEKTYQLKLDETDTKKIVTFSKYLP